MMKKVLLGIGLFVVTLLMVLFFFFNKVRVRDFKNDFVSFRYDSTWKLDESDAGISLKHKKGELVLQKKVLDEDLIDTDLGSIASDIIYGIEEQNKDYKLIDSSEERASYSYLYESNDSNVLLRIYKLDNILVIGYFEAKTEYFDILLDSALGVLDSVSVKR